MVPTMPSIQINPPSLVELAVSEGFATGVYLPRERPALRS